MTILTVTKLKFLQGDYLVSVVNLSYKVMEEYRFSFNAYINTVQMVSFELFPHKFNLSAIFGLRNLHFCCCGVHGEFLNDDNVNYMAVIEFQAACFSQFLIEMTYVP